MLLVETAATVTAATAPTVSPQCLNPLFTGACVGNEVGKRVGGAVVEKIGNSALKDLATDVARGAGALIRDVVTFWLKPPSPTSELAGPDATATWVSSQLVWFTAAAMLAGLLLASARMALFSGPQAARDIAGGIGRVVLASAIALPLVIALMQAGDAFASAMLATVNPEDLVAGWTAMADQDIQYGYSVAILTGVFGIVGGIIQALLLLTRDAMCILLAGLLPLFAASSMTETGVAAWKKATSWLSAFLLYKPVAALIYATAFKMMSIGPLDAKADPATIAQRQLIGVFMLGLALLAMPALMRVMAPVMGQVTGGGSGAGAMGAVGTAVASGARMMRGGGPSAAGGKSKGPVPVKALSGNTGGGGGSTGGGSGPSGGGGGGGGGDVSSPSGSATKAGSNVSGKSANSSSGSKSGTAAGPTGGSGGTSAGNGARPSSGSQTTTSGSTSPRGASNSARPPAKSTPPTHTVHGKPPTGAPGRTEGTPKG